jgi:hypothetical protein
LRALSAADTSVHASGRKHPGQRRGEHWRTTKSSAWARRMNGLRALKLTAEQRRDIARKAALSRWATARQSANPPTNPSGEVANPPTNLSANPTTNGSQT